MLLLAGCEVSNDPAPTATASSAEVELIQKLLAFDAVRVEVGKELVPSLNGLLEQVPDVRKALVAARGIVLPGVNFVDNGALGPQEYVIKLRGVEAGRGTLQMKKLLAVGNVTAFGGATVRDPARGLPATWIDPKLGPQADKEGCVLLDAGNVFSTHLTECARRHAAELLDLTGVELLLETLKKTNPTAAALVPEKISPVQLQQVLQQLLAEGVKVDDLARILETMAAQPLTSPTEVFTEKVRQALARQLSAGVARGDVIEVITVGAPAASESEQKVVYQKLAAALEKSSVLLAAPESRRAWVSFVAPLAEGVTVLSTAEIAPGYTVKSVDSL